MKDEDRKALAERVAKCLQTRGYPCPRYQDNWVGENDNFAGSWRSDDEHRVLDLVEEPEDEPLFFTAFVKTFGLNWVPIDEQYDILWMGIVRPTDHVDVICDFIARWLLLQHQRSEVEAYIETEEIRLRKENRRSLVTRIRQWVSFKLRQKIQRTRAPLPGWFTKRS